MFSRRREYCVRRSKAVEVPPCLEHGDVGLPLGERLEAHRLQALDTVGRLRNPLVVDLVPVLEVVARSLEEDRLLGGDLLSVFDHVWAQVEVAVHDAVLDAERSRELPDPRGVLVQGDEPALRHHEVEGVERLGVVHLVEEPELLLVPLPHLVAEQQVFRVHGLPALSTRRSRDLVRILELTLRGHPPFPLSPRLHVVLHLP